MEVFNSYAIIFIKGHQYKVNVGSVLKIDNLNIKNNNIFLLNNIILFNLKKKYYFNDNFFLKKIFIICRVISEKICKNNLSFKMKRRKHSLKKKIMKSYYRNIIIEKFLFNFN